MLKTYGYDETTQQDRFNLTVRYPMGQPHCESQHINGYVCLRERFHIGPHVAHVSSNEAVAEWTDDND